MQLLEGEQFEGSGVVIEVDSLERSYKVHLSFPENMDRMNYSSHSVFLYPENVTFQVNDTVDFEGTLEQILRKPGTGNDPFEYWYMIRPVFVSAQDIDGAN